MREKKSLTLVNIMSIVILLSLSYVSFTSQANNSNAILLLGDSLSASYGMKENQGWVYKLNQQLTLENASFSLINASLSGETTSGGLARLPRILAEKKIDYLLIELGGNDGLRGFPPALIKNNLLQIINLAQAKGVTVLLMDIKIPPNYGQRYNTMFNDTFSIVAKQSDVLLMPFFMENIAINPALMQNDGIHPNELAQADIVTFMHKLLSDFFIEQQNKNIVSLKVTK